MRLLSCAQFHDLFCCGCEANPGSPIDFASWKPGGKIANINCRIRRCCKTVINMCQASKLQSWDHRDAMTVVMRGVVPSQFFGVVLHFGYRTNSCTLRTACNYSGVCVLHSGCIFPIIKLVVFQILLL